MTDKKLEHITIKHILNNYVFINPVKLIFKQSLGHEEVFNKIQSHHSKPFAYTIRVNGRVREIHFPNYFTYYNVATSICEKLENLTLSQPKFNRLQIDWFNRKLKPDNYRRCFKKDKNDLKFKYDCLSFFDISNFYNSIYTHCFEHINNGKFDFIDEQIRKLNSKKTKGLLLGNVLSTICADKIMRYFCSLLNYGFNLQEYRIVNCDISFFSDQIYIKHNLQDTEYIHQKVTKIIAKDYFEFRLAEQKYKVLTYQDMIKDNIFDKNLEHLRGIFTTDLTGNTAPKRSTSSKDELKLLKHFLNTLLDQLINSNLDKNLHETYVKVAIKANFASPVHLHMLYNAITEAKDEDLEEIKNAVLYLISNYPIIVYDMFQLSMFDAMGIKEWITDDDMQILYYKLTKYDVNDYELLYWFIKIVVLKQPIKKDYETLNYFNKILIAFIIRNAPDFLDDKILNKLDQVIGNLDNMLNENWLIFYEYSRYKNYEIPLPNQDKPMCFKQLVPVINELLKNQVSFICNIAELSQINEVSKWERWDYDDIPHIPDILWEAAVERSGYNPHGY